jgi:hypothetical protein
MAADAGAPVVSVRGEAVVVWLVVDAVVFWFLADAVVIVVRVGEAVMTRVGPRRLPAIPVHALCSLSPHRCCPRIMSCHDPVRCGHPKPLTPRKGYLASSRLASRRPG